MSLEMKHDDREYKWFPLQNMPDIRDEGETLSINDHQFIIASESKEYDGIYVNKYNAQTNEWSEFINSNYCSTYDRRIAYDNSTGRLYICSTNNELDRLQFQHIGHNISLLLISDRNSPFIVNVKGTIHAIGNFGYYENRIKHCIWDGDCFQQIHSFEKYQFLAHSALIYIPTKHMLLLIGGYAMNSSFEEQSVGIWTCDLKSNIWNKIKDLSFEGYGHCVALTSDEQNVIIVGGMDKKRNYYTKDNEMDTIYILNISNDSQYILTKSKVTCPEKGLCNIIRTGGGIKDKMLVIGWIKCQLASVLSVPTSIMHLIVKFYSEEIIHWINRKKHVAVNLSHILKVE
eukprot:384319_1